MRLVDCCLNIRDRYDKFIDNDDIGGPNDVYKLLVQKIFDILNYW